MNNYKSFSELKEELGNNYDFKLYEMGISALKEIENLQQENKQLQEQLLVAQTNEETFRLEMEDITQTLGLDEDTLFDDVKAYVRSLKDNWNELKKLLNQKYYNGERIDIKDILDKIQQQETLMAENQEKLYFLIYEDEKENLKLSSQKAYTRRIILEEILQKYKSIIGEIKDE